MKIDHLAMWVSDLEASKEFFMKYFKASANTKYENPSKGFSSYFLTFGGGCRLELMQRNDISLKSVNHITGFAHLAISVGSKAKVDQLTERLANDGFIVESAPRDTGDGYYESVVLDIEGNMIEITV